MKVVRYRRMDDERLEIMDFPFSASLSGISSLTQEMHCQSLGFSGGHDLKAQTDPPSFIRRTRRTHT